MDLHRSSLLEEAGWALGGTWRLVLSRSDAPSWFDFSQRGLAGSFVPLIIAYAAFVAFMGLGAQQAQIFSAASLLFIFGALVCARFLALRLIFPRLGVLHAFRPVLVAINWSNAFTLAAILITIFAVSFLGAFLLGADSGGTLVNTILIVWAALGLAMLVVEINILRLIAGLGAGDVVIVLAAQIFSLIVAALILGQLPLH
ncbi:hypothetical protein [Pelagibacterium sp.]|uniref:hypothetical protein n=1 Tax=Pelagibacterium sp. TaxID=1967288 RepID=UPI003A8E36F6